MLGFIRYFSALLFICFIFLNIGCSSLNAPYQPDEVWKPPRNNKASKENDPVWRHIVDRKVDAKEPLTLDELIDIAVANNPTTRTAWHNARVQGAAKAQADSAWYPQVSASADYTSARKESTQKALSSDTRSYGAGAQVNWLIFDFGERAANSDAAYYNLLAANFEFNQALQDLILNVEKSYYTLYAARARREAAQMAVKDAKVTLHSANERLSVGLAARLDVLQAKSDYDEALFTLEDSKDDVEDARAGLANALGIPVDDNFDIAQPQWKDPDEITEKQVHQFIEEALEKRPDIAASRASLLASEAAVIAANSALFPTLSLGAEAGKNWNESLLDVTTKEHNYEYSGFLQVQWDVFDGFSNYATKHKATEEAKAQRESLIANELALAADVWSKYYAYKSSFSKLRYSKAFFDAAEEAYDLALEGYRAGLKSILDLVNAQDNLANARSGLVTAKQDILITFAELQHATGSLNLNDYK